MIVQDAISVGAVDTDDMPQCRERITHPEHTVEALCVRHHYLGSSVAQPVIERFRSKQRRERQRNGAKLLRSQMRHGRFRTLRQDDADTVSTGDAKLAQHMR